MNELIIIDNLNNESFLSEWNDALKSNPTGNSFFHNPVVIKNEIEKNKHLEKILFIVIKNNNKIVSIAPMYIENRKVYIKLGIIKIFSTRLKSLKFFGNGIICFNKKLLGHSLDLIFSEISQRAASFDVIHFEYLHSPSEILTFIESNIKKYSLSHSKPSPVGVIRQILFPSTFDDYIKSMEKKSRYKFKHPAKIFFDEYKESATIEEITLPDQVDNFLSDLEKVYKKSWQAKALGSYERCSEAQISWHKNIALNGWLRAFILKHNGIPIAFIRGFQYEGEYYYEEIGYDLQWSSFSVGNVLNHCLIERLFQENTPKKLDFGYGENEYKKTLSNSMLAAQPIYIFSKNSYGSYVLGAQKILNVMHFYIISQLKKYKLDSRIRKLLKKR
jgi:hypothetical protein